MAITEIGSTLFQMGKNAINNPAEFVGYGLSETGKAATKALPKLPNLLPVDQRPLPDETTQDGDAWGSRIRDSYQPAPSKSAKQPKQQHAFNLIGPGQSNIHGGSFEFIG